MRCYCFIPLLRGVEFGRLFASATLCFTVCFHHGKGLSVHRVGTKGSYLPLVRVADTTLSSLGGQSAHHVYKSHPWPLYARPPRAVQRQTAVTAHLKSKQLMPFVFAGLSLDPLYLASFMDQTWGLYGVVVRGAGPHGRTLSGRPCFFPTQPALWQ